MLTHSFLQMLQCLFSLKTIMLVYYPSQIVCYYSDLVVTDLYMPIFKITALKLFI